VASSRSVVVILALGIALLAQNHGNCGTVFDRVAGKGVVRFGLPYNRIPQGFMDKQGQWVGFEVDLAREMARHMNLKLDTVKVNDRTWAQMLSGGQIDAAMCRIRHTRSLEGEFDFSVPYFFDSRRILVRKGPFKTMADLKGRKIAAVQGSLSERRAMRAMKEAGDQASEKNVVSYPDRASCFMALGRDRVAGWMDAGLVLLEYASRSPGRFQIIKGTEPSEDVVVAVPQNDSAWRDLINFTIQDMADDGSLKKIYNKWFGPDTPYAFSSGLPGNALPE
jgi:polar amino acid transport system substrate-binding protein